MSPAAYLAVGAVRVYQWTIRPVIGANCRFCPSCSEYAVEAFRAHGALRGGALAGWRILRCNPWCEGGYDPVPPRRRGEGGNQPARLPQSESERPAPPQPGGPDLAIHTPAGTAGGHDDGKSY